MAITHFVFSNDATVYEVSDEDEHPAKIIAVNNINNDFILLDFNLFFI